MLARCYSLKEKSEFEQVEKEGKVIQSDSFGMAFLNRNDQDPPRIGFIVSTKVSKEAYQRNRIRRSMGEAIRQSLYEMKQGYNLVFLAKQRSTKSSTPTIMSEVKEALRAADLIK